MSNDLVTYQAPSAIPSATTEDIERALTIGDIGKMPPELRIRYYLAACQSAGLNPLTRPLDVLKSQSGQMVLYANKEACEQLRKLHRVSLRIISRDKEDGLYIVTVQASTPDGRVDEAQGIVEISALKGQALATALLKAETKAKRRATLSICGLGFAGGDDPAALPFNPQTGELPCGAADVPLMTPDTATLEQHIADLYGDRAVTAVETSPVGCEITAILEAQGLPQEAQNAFWARLRGKYADLTPGVLAMVRDQLRERQAASVEPETPPIAEAAAASVEPETPPIAKAAAAMDEDIPF